MNADIRERMFHNVALRGYDVLPPQQGFDADSASRNPWDVATNLFGDPPIMVERQPIKPTEHGRSFASNAAFTPLHTDSQMFGGVSPHVQLMFCAKPARDGGISLLVDTRALLEMIQRDKPRLFHQLFTQSRRIPFVFGDVVGPTVTWRAGCLVFTHSPMRVDDEIGHELQSCLSRMSVIEVPVHEGEILVVDNHRMLHGRTAFADPARLFARLLVWRRMGFSRHTAFDSLARAQAERERSVIQDPQDLRRRGLGHWPSEAVELRRRVVLEMLRGVAPGVLAQRHGIAEPMLYRWRDAAVAAMDEALE